MRPDEHKKKKNAEYKKKHGMSAKKETKKEEVKKGTPEKPHIPETKQENTAKETETRSFSRRKVTSNWDRYEDLDYSGATNDGHQKSQSRRGADFATLVEEAGDSHSQFRFQAEKEWEEDSVGTQDIQSVLKINFEDLSQALKSLPLYKKLNLEEREVCQDLQPELICDHMKTTKEMPQSINIQNERSGDFIFKDSDVSHKTSSHLSNHKSKTGSNQPLTGTDTHTNKTQENKKITASNLHMSMKHMSSEKSDTSSTGDSAEIRNAEKPDDDELDFLLSLDTGRLKNSFDPTINDKNASNISQTDTKKQNVEVTNIDISKASDSPNTKSDSGSLDVQKPEEDLEDWLDSVLA